MPRSSPAFRRDQARSAADCLTRPPGCWPIWSRRRRQIIEMIVAERQREKHATRGDRSGASCACIKALEKELTEMDQDIGDSVRGSPAVAGEGGSAGLGARRRPDHRPHPHRRTPRARARLDRREIAALAGLAPWTRQSGKWRGRSFIGGGRSAVRTALFKARPRRRPLQPAAASTSMQHLARRRQTQDAVALIAVARKLLTILNAILRDNRPWQQPA